MGAEELARFLRLIGKRIDISSFDSRLEIQKIVYLAQEIGINLGYSFNWYMRGPYSKELTDDYYSLKSRYIPPDQGPSEELPDRGTGLLRKYIDDTEWLEAAASMVWIRQNYYGKEDLATCKGRIVSDVSQVYKTFDPAYALNVLDELANNSDLLA